VWIGGREEESVKRVVNMSLDLKRWDHYKDSAPEGQSQQKPIIFSS
jgi:hypothetical protein